MGEASKHKRNKTKYVEYDYESLYDKQIEKMDEALEREMLKLKNKCVYATKEISAGVMKEIEIYPEFSRAELKGNGAKKRNKEAQSNLNDKNARKHLVRLINTNFENGDMWITLTYSDEHLPNNMDEALRNIKNFMRRINYRRNKEGLDKAKYIYITEYVEGKKGIRCHHHIVMDGALSMDTVESTWKYGRRNNLRKLSMDECGLTGVANYLAKDPKGNKRWCSSTNLKQPKIKKNHYKFKKKKVQDLVKHRDSIKSEMEKTYPGYIFIDTEIRFNEYNSMFYIYTRMRKKLGGKE
ncbi:MAG: rolling circle replication-associated protein [Paraclostridium sp.]